MADPERIGDLPVGPILDPRVRVRKRLEAWLKILPPGQHFTYHQARKCIKASWERTRQDLNYFEEKGWVEKLERARLWRRL